MTFTEDMARMATDLKEQFGVTITVRNVVVSTFSTTTGTHSKAETTVSVTAIRGDPRIVPTGQGNAREEQLEYTVKVGDLGFTPDANDLVEETVGAFTVKRQIVSVSDSAHQGMIELRTRRLLS